MYALPFAWLRRPAWALAAALLCAAAATTQQSSEAFDPHAIDGSKAPEKIPDRYAYHQLFTNLAGPVQDVFRDTFRRDSQLSDSDAAIVIQTAERFQRVYADTAPQPRARRDSSRPLPPAAMDQFKLWAERMEAELNNAMSSLQRELSPEGVARMQVYMLKYVKPTMQVHLSDADLAAGLGLKPGEKGSMPPPDVTIGPDPPLPYTLTGPAAALAIDQADRAFAVLSVTEREHDYRVELMNRTSQPIAAFRVSPCPPWHATGGGIETLGGPLAAIEPGAVYVMSDAKPIGPHCTPYQPRANVVIFDDGTSAGLPQEVEKVKLQRIGQMAGVEYTVRILSAFDPRNSPDWDALIRSIEVESPEAWSVGLQRIIDAHLSGIDAGMLKALNHEGLFALSLGEGHARTIAAFEVKQIAEATDLPPSAQASQFDALLAEYRALRSFFEEFRKTSAGSLDH